MRRKMENMKPRYKAVLFDFDGTLADTSEGIFKSLQYAFEADGKPSPPLSTLRKFIGPPIYDSFQTLFGYPDDKIGFMIEKYRERYRARGWREARPRVLPQGSPPTEAACTASIKIWISAMLNSRRSTKYSFVFRRLQWIL